VKLLGEPVTGLDLLVDAPEVAELHECD